MSHVFGRRNKSLYRGMSLDSGTQCTYLSNNVAQSGSYSCCSSKQDLSENSFKRISSDPLTVSSQSSYDDAMNFFSHAKTSDSCGIAECFNLYLKVTSDTEEAIPDLPVLVPGLEAQFIDDSSLKEQIRALERAQKHFQKTLENVGKTLLKTSIPASDEYAQDQDDEMEFLDAVEGEWECPKCTFVNPEMFLQCDMCHYVNEHQEVNPHATIVCDLCSAENFAEDHTCRKCSARFRTSPRGF